MALKKSSSDTGNAMVVIKSGNTSPAAVESRVTRSSSAKAKGKDSSDSDSDPTSTALIPSCSRDSNDLEQLEKNDDCEPSKSSSLPKMTKVTVNPVRLLLILGFELLGAQLTGVATVSKSSFSNSALLFPYGNLSREFVIGNRDLTRPCLNVRLRSLIIKYSVTL